MKKTHNPPLHGQRSITILLVWMMYARKKNTKRERLCIMRDEWEGQSDA
jgi:hypothetical protein